MSFTIEKGIPVRKSARGGKSKYPFAQMSVEDEDSIVIEVAQDKAPGRKSSVYASAKRAGFKVRIDDEIAKDGTFIGLRVWRVE